MKLILFLYFFLFTFAWSPHIGKIVATPIFKSISVTTFLSIFLIFLIWAGSTVKGRSFFIKTPINWPFALVVISYVLSDFAGYVISGYEPTISSLFTQIRTPYPYLLFLAILFISKNVSQKEKFLKVVAFGSILPAVIGILEWYDVWYVRDIVYRYFSSMAVEDIAANYQYRYTYRSSSLYEATNLFGVFTSFMAVLSLYLFIGERKNGKGKIFFSIFLINTASQFYSQSRTATIALLIGIATLFLFEFRSKIKGFFVFAKRIFLIALALFGIMYVSEHYLGFSHFFTRLGFRGDLGDHYDAIAAKLIQLQMGARYTSNITEFNPLLGIGWSNDVGFINDIGWALLFTKVGAFGLIAEIILMISVYKLAKKTWRLSKGTASASIPLFLIYFVIARIFVNFGGIYLANEMILQLQWILIALCYALYKERSLALALHPAHREHSTSFNSENPRRLLKPEGVR